jgi:glucose/arabinose dehydrogenase
MRSIRLLVGIGLGLGVTVFTIALLFGFPSYTILKYGESGPKLLGPHEQSLAIETAAEGLSFPTSMEFIDNENILVLEKDHGTVRLVSSSNGTLEKEPLLNLSVENEAERGLLGVAILQDSNMHNMGHSINSNNDSTNTGSVNDDSISIVFLYYTEKPEYGNENDYPQQIPRNKVLSYEWNKQAKSLVNSKLVLDLPSEPGPYHQGGKLKIGPDNALYAVVGDLNTIMGQLQNDRNGTGPNDSSVILRVNPYNGSPAEDNPFFDIDKMSRYYAYGIRNSFGIDFDPLTGNLWETENGEENYDELNMVKPGFNSGWAKIMGPISRNDINAKESLVKFPGSEYSDPVFSWNEQIGVTDIEFFNSSKLGIEYANNIFVGDINNGNLYYFKINGNRTGIDIVGHVNENRYNDRDYDIQGGLQQDLVADNKEELSEVTFGTNFGRITDIETGPDGFLYILSYENGKIYRIVNNQR